MAGRAATTSVLNNSKFRAILYQLIMASLLIYLGWSIAENTIANMEARDIRAGFGFLDETAGFSIMMSLVPYEPGDTYGRVFLVGLLNTLLVAGIGVVFATMVGFLVGAFSMIGVPPTCGFFSKWYLISGAIEAGQWHFMLALLFSSLVNAIIFFRIIEIGFFGSLGSETPDPHEHQDVAVKEAPLSMVLPMLVVAGALIGIGIYTSDIISLVIQNYP